MFFCLLKTSLQIFAMGKQHQYQVSVKWTGNLGEGTTHYRAYARDHLIYAAGKAPIAASSDPAFRGDPDRYNPEELFLAALSGCHMLWYLHLCAVAGIQVTAYEDQAAGVMEETSDGSGRFESVTLYPRVVITNAESLAQAAALHTQANKMCFIANSVNFPVQHEPKIDVATV